MRCPHCAGEIPEGSHFCGICGNHIAGELPPPAPPAPPPIAAASSPSLFELPAAHGPRRARIFVVVTLNLILAGAGVAMIVSYFARRAAAVEKQSEPSDRVEAPSPVPSTTAEIEPPPPAQSNAEDTVLAASVGTGSPSPAARKKAAPRKPDSESPREARSGSGPADKPLDLAAEIDALASRHQRQLQSCYQQAAKTLEPETPLEGRVDIRFTIMPDGRATGGRAVANTTGSEALGSCLVEVVESWSFPPGAAKPLDFVWPFRFRSRAP